MEILKNIKNTDSINYNFASQLIHCLEIQLLAKFLLAQTIPIFNNVLQIQNIITSNLIEKVVILNFIFNILVLTYLIFQFLFKHYENKTSKICNKSLLKIVKLMPYILFVQIINVNTIAISTLSLTYLILAFINIGFMLIQIFLLKLANLSYRFDDKNYLKRKNNTLICWLLIIPIIAASNMLQSTYTCLLLSFRSFCQLYINFFSLQNDVIRKLEYFYPFLTFSITIMYFAKFTLSLSIFENLICSIFCFSFAIYSSLCLSQTLLIKSLRYHLSDNAHLFQLQNQDISQETKENLEKYMDKDESEKFLLFIRILSNVYMSKQHFQSNLLLEIKSSQRINNFDIWWTVFNRSILKHKVQCCTITCQCKKLKFRSKDNQRIINSIFLTTISTLLRMLFGNSVNKNYKMLIIQKYFMIQFQNKPLKAYYELIKLYHQKLHLQQQLQVQDLIKQTKNIFQRVFLTQKVQNQNLQIQPILDFQQKIKQIKNDFGQITLNYTKFYQVFTKSFIQMDSLKKFTQILTQIKTNLNAKFDLYLIKFDRNIQFLTLALIFYRFVDQYTGKIGRIQQKTQNLIVHMSNPLRQIKDQIDIFDPFYGAVKIDLVFSPGKIICITKNICQLLNFKTQQLIGQTVNRIMPLTFARYHTKFLKKFIQDGTFTVLKKKQRVFYAKHSNKFIFPITVRLKVNYLDQGSFSAISLINKTQTKSEFIMINNHGKIEEISQNIFKMLFKPAFNDQIAKIKRLSLYKMLLSLNFLLKDVSEQQNNVYQGLLMTCDSQQILQRVFKAPQFSRYFKGEQLSSQKSTKSQPIQCVSATSKQFVDNSDDKQKFQNDLKESFKDFIRILKLGQVRAYRLNYKFYEIVTSQFKCKMVEILSVKQQLTDEMIDLQVAQQVVDIGLHYGLQKQATKTFKTLTDISRSEFNKNSSSNDQAFTLLSELSHRSKTKTRIKTQILHESEASDTLQNFLTCERIKTLNRFDDNFTASENSSFIQQNEEIRLRQTLMLAFEKKDFVNKKAEIGIIILILLLSLTFCLVCVFSMNLQNDYKQIQLDNLVIANVRLNLQYRLAFQQVQHFYGKMNITTPSFLQTKNAIISSDLKNIIQNSIKWINYDMSNSLYEKQVQWVNASNGYKQNRQILFTMNQIYSMFIMSEVQRQYLSDNYIQINTQLAEIQTKQKQIILDKSQGFRIKIHIVVAIYLALLICLILVFIWTNRHSIEKQDQVSNFLPFVNIKQTNKKLKFYQMFYQHLKQHQTLSLQQIQKLDQQKKIISQTNKTIQTKSRNSRNNSPILHIVPAIKQMQTSATQSKLLHIVKHQYKLFTFKNGLFFIFLLTLCVSVVLYAQIFFMFAHQKFKAYIILKDATMIMQNMPARMTFLHFSNLHNLLNGLPLISYPQQFYVIAHDQRFKLRMNLSTVDYFQTDMAVLIDKHITSNICLLTTCPKNSNTTVNRQLSYLTNRLRNGFDYIRTVKQLLPYQTNVKSKLDKWLKQNKVRSLIQAIDSVLDLVKLSERQITQLFDSQIQSIGRRIFYISLALIPFLILIVAIVRKKFIEFVAKRLEITQNIYKHFSWSILSTNSYAVNYFQQKIKNIKHH